MNAETSHQLSTYDPELFEMLIKGRAEHISNNRKLEIIFWRYLEDLNNMGKLPWNEEQMRWDWSEACALVTLQILEGDKLTFPQIEPRSFKHLEGVWLKRVKKLKAYYMWKAIP